MKHCVSRRRITVTKYQVILNGESCGKDIIVQMIPYDLRVIKGMMPKWDEVSFNLYFVCLIQGRRSYFWMAGISTSRLACL